MLVRRLLLLAAVLMLVSVAAAAVAPQPPAPRVTPQDREARPLTPASPTAELERAVSTDAGRPRTITVEEGDRLRLIVEGDEPQTVEIVGLDRIATLAPDTPATFDILADEPGEYPLTVLESGRTFATLEIVSDQAE